MKLWYLKLLSFIFSIFFLFLACTHSDQKNTSNIATEKQSEGEVIYKQYCVTCHGQDGQLGLNGAANLKTSKLTREERIEVITNGRKMMTPYGKILTQKQVGSVADYILSFNR